MANAGHSPWYSHPLSQALQVLLGRAQRAALCSCGTAAICVQVHLRQRRLGRWRLGGWCPRRRCYLEVDGTTPLSSCETAAFCVQARLRQRRLGGRRPRRRCYLLGTRDGSPPPCGCGPSVLFVGTLYFLLTKSTVSQQKVQRPEKSTDQKGKRHICRHGCGLPTVTRTPYHDRTPYKTDVRAFMNPLQEPLSGEMVHWDSYHARDQCLPGARAPHALLLLPFQDHVFITSDGCAAARAVPLRALD